MSPHQTLCQALRRDHLVSTLFEAIAKKKKKTRFVTVWVPGTGGEDMETTETRVKKRNFGQKDD